MSNIKELIRAEIRKWRSIVEERCPESTRSRDYTKEEWNAIYEYNAYTRILSFLDTLPDEPEQPTRGYDEAYLNEKIAKASKTWKGVDVDKFMDEIRGREPVSNCHDLKEAAEKYASGFPFDNEWQSIANNAFIAGAGWMAKQQPLPEDSVAFQKGVQEGRRLMMEEWLKDRDGCFWDGVNEGKKAMKEQMMEGAVECSASVCKLADKVWVTPNDEKKFHQDVFDHFIAGDKVRIIIAKEDEQ